MGIFEFFKKDKINKNIKFNNKTLRFAVKKWLDNEKKAEAKYGHISNWDTAEVTDMSELFLNAYTFNESINKWDVSKVTNMHAMFDNAYVFNQPLSNWDVSKVTDMSEMFSSIETLAFNQPIGNWDVSMVTNMEGMFSEAVSFNQPIGDWDVSKVTNMSLMFYGAISFNQPIGNWNVSSVSNTSGMFIGAISFNQPIGDWDVSKVITMKKMFSGANSFNQPIGDWDVKNLKNMTNMFHPVESFPIESIVQDIDNWKLTNEDTLFERAVYKEEIKDFKGAIVDYKKAIAVNPSKKELYIFCINNCESAIADSDKLSVNQLAKSEIDIESTEILEFDKVEKVLKKTIDNSNNVENPSPKKDHINFFLKKPDTEEIKVNWLQDIGPIYPNDDYMPHILIHHPKTKKDGEYISLFCDNKEEAEAIIDYIIKLNGGKNKYTKHEIEGWSHVFSGHLFDIRYRNELIGDHVIVELNRREERNLISYNNDNSLILYGINKDSKKINSIIKGLNSIVYNSGEMTSGGGHLYFDSSGSHIVSYWDDIKKAGEQFKSILDCYTENAIYKGSKDNNQEIKDFSHKNLLEIIKNEGFLIEFKTDDFKINLSKGNSSYQMNIYLLSNVLEDLNDKNQKESYMGGFPAPPTPTRRQSDLELEKLNKPEFEIEDFEKLKRLLGSRIRFELKNSQPLTPREAEVVQMYFGLNDLNPMTLEEIGKTLDLTRERVRQIKNKAIRRLKHTTKSKILKNYIVNYQRISSHNF